MGNTGRGNAIAGQNENGGVEKTAPEMEIEVRSAEVVQGMAAEQNNKHN